MPPILLPKLKGFAFKFGQPTSCSPYLEKYEDELLGNSERHHRSKVTLNLVREDVLSFSNKSSDKSLDPLFQLVIRKVADDFRLNARVKPFHLNDVFKQQLPIWNSSPGLPYKFLGFKTKNDVRKDHHQTNNIRLFWHRIKTGEFMTLPDCCAFMRSHLAPEGEEKVRAVWGYPMQVTMAEAMFALPLIDAYRHQSKPIAYGYEVALGGTRRILKRFANKKNLAAIDFKSFDKTVPRWLVNAAFYILEDNLDFTAYRDHGTPNVIGLLRVWNSLKTYFSKTPIRLANGERYKKISGIASGSYFTQLIGSICNALILNYVSISRLNVWPEDYIVFGDDSLISFKSPLALDLIASSVAEFGMIINRTKTAQSNSIADLEFLGYEIGGLPRKSYSKWIYALLYPEHPDMNWDAVASRALGLYYANLGVDSHIHALLHRIITVRDFDIVLSRSMEKMLRIIGFGHDVERTKTLPTAFDLLTTYIYR